MKEAFSETGIELEIDDGELHPRTYRRLDDVMDQYRLREWWEAATVNGTN